MNVTAQSPQAACSEGAQLSVDPVTESPKHIYGELLLPKGAVAFKEAGPPMSCCAITCFNSSDLSVTLSGTA